MCAGGTHYNTTPTFDTIERTDAYVNSSIAVNIQNSLKFYQYGSHFRSLHELYEKNELASAINRVVEDMNHRFTVDVLTKDFKSSDCAISDAHLIRDRSGGTDILRKLDVKKLTTELKDLLEIKNRNEQKVEITEGIAAEIEEYLRMLDLVYYIDVVSAVNPEKKKKTHCHLSAGSQVRPGRSPDKVSHGRYVIHVPRAAGQGLCHFPYSE